MQRFSPATPLGFLELVLRGRVDRARNTDDRGASAVEWVVISAIVVAIAIAIGVILQGALEGKANDIGSEIDGAGG
jgi:Flp pilus assembly pilin Flp